MKKLIFKNIFTDVIYFFIITSLSLTLVVWVIQAVNLLDLVSEDGHGFKLYFLYTFLILPKIFTKLIIFIFFLSTFYVLNKYEENNEILIFWTFGVNKLEFINKFILFAFFFLLLQLVLNFYVVPKSLFEARQLFKQSDFSYFPSLIKSKHFNDHTKNLTIFIEDKDEKGNFKNIFVKEKFSSNNSQIINSKTGKIVEKNKKSFLVLVFYGSRILLIVENIVKIPNPIPTNPTIIAKIRKFFFATNNSKLIVLILSVINAKNVKY